LFKNLAVGDKQLERRGRLSDLFNTKEISKTTVLLWIIW